MSVRQEESVTRVWGAPWSTACIVTGVPRATLQSISAKARQSFWTYRVLPSSFNCEWFFFQFQKDPVLLWGERVNSDMIWRTVSRERSSERSPHGDNRELSTARARTRSRINCWDIPLQPENTTRLPQFCRAFDVRGRSAKDCRVWRKESTQA